MSHFLKAILGLLLASTHCLASGTAQPRPTMTVDENGFVTLAWLSLPGHTYFMQCSFDMVTWTYFGEVIHSGFGIEKVTFDPTTGDHVYPITSAVPGRPNASPVPQLTQAEIQTYFDRVYLSQANLKCQIVLKPATIITWDNSTEGNYSQPFENQAEHPKVDDTFLDITTGVVSPEIAQIVQTDPNGNSIFNGQLLPRNELHLFLMGGCTFIRTIITSPPNNRIVERNARGFADISNGRCFVVASTIPESPHSIDVMASIRPQILNTMAHEIGHLIITGGHPDQYNPTVIDPNDPLAHGGGPAPLAMDPFLHQRRLMASGLIRNLGRELVLEEWNQIKLSVDDINSKQTSSGN
jgi:hypothetical protein